MQSVNITAAAPTTTVVRSKPGKLGRIIVNKAAANGVITVYDGIAVATGTVVATITMPATLLANQIVLDYDLDVAEGITVVTSAAAQDITVTHSL
jgi:hypothetical protein